MVTLCLKALISPYPIMERVDLSKVTVLDVDAGWRGPEETEAFLATLRNQFDELGYAHIALRAIHKLRRGMIIISGIIYKIDTGRKAPGVAVADLKKLKKKMQPLIDWCAANCSAAFYLDENGMNFASEEDALLFRLKFLS